MLTIFLYYFIEIKFIYINKTNGGKMIEYDVPAILEKIKDEPGLKGFYNQAIKMPEESVNRVLNFLIEEEKAKNKKISPAN